MGGASGGFGLGFDTGAVKADGAGGLWAGGLDGAGGLWAGGLGAAGSVRADGAGGMRAGRLRAGWLGAVVNKTPPTLQKQAGSGGLHQIMPQRGSQGVNKAL